MNHQILWAAVIMGSFIMMAQSTHDKNGVAAFLWNLTSLAALFAGYFL